MLFNSFQFVLFFLAVLPVYWALPRRHRNGFLLAASLLFYTLWIPSYLLLLIVDVLVNYALLRAMVRSQRPRFFLVSSIVFTLGLLAYFKYAAFLLEMALPLLRQTLDFPLPLPEVFLPLGISFYSFQILALTIDTYRGRLETVSSLSRYTLFVSFFPQLIAGPILRGHQFLPQLERGGEWTAERGRRGLCLIASGVFKKVVLADFLLAPFVNEVFSVPGLASTAFHWMALYSFAFQIYFDFSGYTDIARGLACLLGFEVPRNFLEPYLARNPTEFWRRWHITLSNWLRDYLYIPLGGNRLGPSRTAVNVALTMLLGGLWHGAGWNFALWGALHGAWLVLHRVWGRRRDPDAPLGLRDIPSIVFSFHVVCLLWVFFRAPSFEQAWGYMGGLLGGGELHGWPLFQSLVVVACIGLHGLERSLRLNWPRLQAALDRPWGPAWQGAAWGTLTALAGLVAGAGGEFIYFQF